MIRSQAEVEFEGALYHVIARGNHRRDIFRDEADRLRGEKGIDCFSIDRSALAVLEALRAKNS